MTVALVKASPLRTWEVEADLYLGVVDVRELERHRVPLSRQHHVEASNVMRVVEPSALAGEAQTPKVRPAGLLRHHRVGERRGFFFSSRRRHTSSLCDWSSDVCSSDLW